MGRATHRRRTPAENRSSNFSSDDSTLYSEAPSAPGGPGPALDDFRAQSHEGHHRHRLLCRCDSNVSVDLRDRDRIYSQDLDQSLKSLGLTVLKTPYKSPQANAFCERLIGSARRECFDFMIPLNETHVRQTFKSWTSHYNRGRPHSSLGPGTPDQSSPKAELQIERHRIPKGCYIVSVSILGGLHHEYRLEKTPA